MIKRPQKAPNKPITDEELHGLIYPVYGSPKLDGFRCVTGEGNAFTSSMKLIVNRHVQSILSRPEYAGYDGEICVGPPNAPDVFARTTSALRRIEGEPNFEFYIFDIHNSNASYKTRFIDTLTLSSPHMTRLSQYLLNSQSDVISFESWCVEQGFEGAMIRSPQGLYKEGRCTLKEQNIFKRKPVEDDEAVIIGFIEQMENQNEAKTNELGNSARSSCKENKAGKDTLGAFALLSKRWQRPFYCGTGIGLTDELRQKIWNNQDKYLNKTVTYKYQKYGSINAPRQPIFKGFRDSSDITDY